MLKASDDLNCDHLIIVTFNEEKNIKQNGKLIKVVPARKWFVSQE